MNEPEVFNTPFELGLRMVFLLRSLHPRKADLQKLMYLDYAAIYSGDLNGPLSLHTPVPLRGAEYASRREVIEEGLYLMAARAFVDAVATEEGIKYGVGENGPALLELLGGEYPDDLKDRCFWVADALGDKSDAELETIFGANGHLWRTHFIGRDASKGLV